MVLRRTVVWITVRVLWSQLFLSIAQSIRRSKSPKFEARVKAVFSVGSDQRKGIRRENTCRSSSQFISKLSEVICSKRKPGKCARTHPFLPDRRSQKQLINKRKKVHEIAYIPRFEYPQYFNNFFKSKRQEHDSNWSYRNLNWVSGEIEIGVGL